MGLVAAGMIGTGQDVQVWDATVLAGESGASLAGITFRDPAGALMARSDARGKVTFTAPVGTRLALAGDGRIEVPLVLSGVPRDLGILTLERSATLTGTLLNADGSPAGGQELWLVSPYVESRYLDEPDRAGHLHQIKVTTQVDGAFRFDGFWIGPFGGALLVGPAGQIMGRFQSAPRDSIHMGPVKLPPLRTAIGQVVDADGAPVPGARVAVAPIDSGADLAEDPEGILWELAVTDARGAYALELAAGVYAAVAVGGGDASLQGLEVRDEPDPSVFPTIRLSPTGTIGGRIVKGDGNPLVGAQVAIGSRFPSDYAELALPITAETDADGCWFLPDVPKSQYEPAGYLRVVVFASADPTPIRYEAVDDSWSCFSAEPTRTGQPTTHPSASAVSVDCTPKPSCTVTWQTLESGETSQNWFPGPDPLGRHRRVLMPGGWVVTASAPGYVAQERTIEVVTGEEQMLRFNLELRHDATDLDVIVFGPTGLPASLAAVWLSPSDRHNDVYFSPAATGADGIAKFPSVPPGRYELSARRFRYMENTSHTVRLPADGPHVEMALSARPRNVQIAGRVLDSDGEPVGGAAVIAIEAKSSSASGATVTAFDGAFAVDLPAGGYRLSAYAPRHGFGMVREQIVLVEGEHAERTLRLDRGADVDGVFTISGAPAQSAGISGPHEWPMFYLPAWTTRTGTYHLRGLPPGDWTMSVGSYESGQVEFVVHVADDLTVQAPTPALEAPPSYTVSGRVMMHGVPMVGAPVFSSPLLASGQPSADETDEDGGFSIVAPLETSKIYVGLDAPFTHEIAPLQGDRRVEIAVHGAPVRGRVLHQVTGAPIRTAEIFLGRKQPFDWTHSYQDFHRVDGNGRFNFGTLPAGTWTIQVDANGYTQEIVTLELGDEDRDLRVDLEPTVGLHVRVSDAEGNRIENVGLVIQRPGESARLDDGWDREAGEFWWPSAPLGPGLLTIAADYSDLYFRGEINNTGEPIDITLRPAGRLEVQIAEEVLPGIYDTRYPRGNGWQAQLVGADGIAVAARDVFKVRPLLELRHGDPKITARAVAPGEYRLTVTGPNGFEWTTRVAIRAGERTSVQVPPR